MGVALLGGRAAGGGSCRIVGSTEVPAPAEDERGAGPGSPPAGRDERRSAAPPPGGAPTASARAEEAGGVGLGLLPRRGSVAPPPAVRCDTPPGTPRLARLGA